MDKDISLLHKIANGIEEYQKRGDVDGEIELWRKLNDWVQGKVKCFDNLKEFESMIDRWKERGII